MKQEPINPEKPEEEYTLERAKSIIKEGIIKPELENRQKKVRNSFLDFLPKEFYLYGKKRPRNGKKIKEENKQEEDFELNAIDMYRAYLIAVNENNFFEEVMIYDEILDKNLLFPPLVRFLNLLLENYKKKVYELFKERNKLFESGNQNEINDCNEKLNSFKKLYVETEKILETIGKIKNK